MIAIDDAPCGTLAFGDDGRIAHANVPLLATLGYARDELVGRPLDTILPPAGRIFALTHLRPMLQLHGHVEEMYFALRSRDGTDVPVLANAVRCEAADSMPVLNVLATIAIRRREEFEQRLVSARRSAEEALHARAELLALREAQNAELERMAARLRELAARTDVRHERTSRATARSLHEDVAQEIAALKLGLDEVRRAAGAGPLQASVERLERIAAQSLAQVRALSYELHPPVLDHADLPTALRAAAREFESAHGLRVEFRVAAPVPRVDHETRVVLYRFVEEALDNAARHGQPSCVRVALDVDGDALVVSVADDGVGADAVALERDGAIGLLARRERIARLGGELKVESEPARGFSVTARVPVREG